MRVSRRIAAVYFLSSFLMGMGASLLVYLNHGTAGMHQRAELAAGLIFVIVLIIISGKFYHYQQSLKRSNNNLDEAQKLAGLGSWERDLVTGKGYWSDNRYRLFGLTPAKTAPQLEEFYELIHADDRDHVRQTVIAAVRDGSNYEVSYRLANDIHDRIFLSRGHVILDESGKPFKILGTTQDITEKCRQEDFLRDLVKQKNFFINRLGHDLKTPLTPLVALLPMIRDNTVDEKQRNQIEICIRSTTIIRDLVTKTMDLARRSSASRPRLHFEDLFLATVVDNLLESMGSTIKAQGLYVSNLVGKNIVVHADRKELEELFCNLISNAIKFSPLESKVHIEAENGNGQVSVTVKDSGIGLSQEEKPQIFDEFYKADASRHELGSSGLGLSICRHIVENHGGRIWAESDGKGLGTSIHFTLDSGGAV